MNRWIRWQGLVVFLVVMILLSGLWLFFADRLLERLIETQGTRVLGAKVEMDSADLSLFPLALSLNGLQVTNPDEPMKNAFEVARVRFSIETPNLLRRKIVIEEMVLDGVRLNRARGNSGAVSGGPAPATATRSGSAQKGLCADTGPPSFEMPDVEEILRKEELQAVKLTTSLDADIMAEEAQWRKRLPGLPGPEKFEQYKGRIDRLKSKGKGLFGGVRGSAGDIASVQKDLQNDLRLIRAAREEFDRKKESLQKRLAAAEGASWKDVERLRKKYTLSVEGLTDVSRWLMGPKLCGWTRNVVSWYERLRPLLERVKERKKGRDTVKPIRGGGVNVRFKENSPLPDLLIRKVKAQVDLPQGDLTGKIENITPDQDVLGIPLTFAFIGEKLAGLRSLEIDGALDHVVPARSQETMNFHLAGVEVGNLALSDRPGWPFTLSKASVDVQLKALLMGEEISADLTADFSSVKISPRGDKPANALAGALVSALSDVSQFKAKADVTGTLADYDIRLTTDLDRVLKSVAGEVLKKQSERFEKELEKAVLARVGDPTAKAKGGLSRLDAIGSEMTRREGMGKGLLRNLRPSF